MHSARPKFLALHQIKLPLPGIVSIFHRVSGALMFLALPLVLWMLQQSLRSSMTYDGLTETLHSPFSKLVLLALSWAFLYHFCAGIRCLLIDIHLGASLAQARASSKWVLALSTLATIWLGVRLW
jgi:succinate dehydrogenase / fumarate reductase cytochrome b subunit